MERSKFNSASIQTQARGCRGSPVSIHIQESGLGAGTVKIAFVITPPFRDKRSQGARIQPGAENALLETSRFGEGWHSRQVDGCSSLARVHRSYAVKSGEEVVSAMLDAASRTLVAAQEKPPGTRRFLRRVDVHRSFKVSCEVNCLAFIFVSYPPRVWARKGDGNRQRATEVVARIKRIRGQVDDTQVLKSHFAAL
jgi:hypothetical protein